MTERYQDYVIKGGQFVGKFEEMYQKFDDPWEQKAAAVSYVRHSTLFTLEYLQAKKVLEIGCGLGYFSHYIHEHLPYLQLTGMDISSTAVQKAKAKFPELSFVEGDIMRKIPPCPRGGGHLLRHTATFGNHVVHPGRHRCRARQYSGKRRKIFDCQPDFLQGRAEIRYRIFYHAGGNDKISAFQVAGQRICKYRN